MLPTYRGVCVHAHGRRWLATGPRKHTKPWAPASSAQLAPDAACVILAGTIRPCHLGEFSSLSKSYVRASAIAPAAEYIVPQSDRRHSPLRLIFHVVAAAAWLYGREENQTRAGERRENLLARSLGSEGVRPPSQREPLHRGIFQDRCTFFLSVLATPRAETHRRSPRDPSVGTASMTSNSGRNRRGDDSEKTKS
ncbi:hypothetical protein Bbelb_168610 [Branchiostoma belcheri]|nr:hypothetical protein Bbelb_168610 [Branchiostoma belcheri]